MNEVIFILRSAMEGLSSNRIALFRVALLPITLLVILKFSVFPNLTGVVSVRAVTFIYLTVYAFCMLSMFRLLIVGHHSIPLFGLYTLSKSSVYFVLYLVCLFIVLYAMRYFIFSVSPSSINWSLFIFLKIYLLSRVMLVFPAISVNTYFSFTTSWRRTKKYPTIMLMVSVIVVLLRECSKYLSSQVTQETMFGGLIIEVAIWLMIVAILSETFKVIQMHHKAGELS